jgi:hypothetical protein
VQQHKHTCPPFTTVAAAPAAPAKGVVWDDCGWCVGHDEHRVSNEAGALSDDDDGAEPSVAGMVVAISCTTFVTATAVQLQPFMLQ